MSYLKEIDSARAVQRRGLIYVVDDEPMLLELAKVILEREGYVVEVFHDPQTAVQAFKELQPRPEVLITDYAMHTMNGMELIARFKRIEPGQKIILVSGTVGEDIFINSAYKPDRFLAKPYRAHQLSNMVEELLAAD